MDDDFLFDYLILLDDEKEEEREQQKRENSNSISWNREKKDIEKEFTKDFDEKENW